MEELPKGANFKRAKLLWETGLHMAGDPTIPYGGNRDMCITIGSGSGESFKPWMRMATGSAVLAHAVVRGEIEMAIVNPSGLLTQAYRGVGLFSEPLPVRAVASYPSWDRFACAIHPRTHLGSLNEIKERRYPLRLSIREDPTHSTRVLIDQLLAAYGFTLNDLESWGGSLQLIGGPGDRRRMEAAETGEIDAIFDEGIRPWLAKALAAGMRPVKIDEAVLDHLESLGWRRAVIPRDRFSGLEADHVCVDFSGWPLYTRASLPDEDVYKVCAALNARAGEIPWEDSFAGVERLGRDAEETPLDVPLHPGAAQWYRDQNS